MMFEPPTVCTPNSIETVSGIFFDVTNPDPKLVRWHDICWSLSRQARFAGHTTSEEIWSIGQHTLLVYDLLESVLDPSDKYELRSSLRAWVPDVSVLLDSPSHCIVIKRVLQAGLVHDGSEAYLVDVPSPIKRLTEMKPYRLLEDSVSTAICLALVPGLAKGSRMLTVLCEDVLKWADLLALRIEAANLMPGRGREWTFRLPECSSLHMYLMPKVKGWRPVYEELFERGLREGLLERAAPIQALVGE